MPNPFQYLKFLFTSTNQHRVHSPFVYSYVTKCLYSNSNIKERKSIRVLLKSIAYFKAEKICIISKNVRLQNLVTSEFPQIEIDKRPFDLIYIDNPDLETIKKNITPGNFHNDTMLLVNKIHSNKESLDNWNWVMNNDCVTVTVDMYHCMAVFFRKEQAKEHFKIRI